MTLTVSASVDTNHLSHRLILIQYSLFLHGGQIMKSRYCEGGWLGRMTMSAFFHRKDLRM